MLGALKLNAWCKTTCAGFEIDMSPKVVFRVRTGVALIFLLLMSCKFTCTGNATVLACMDEQNRSLIFMFSSYSGHAQTLTPV